LYSLHFAILVETKRVVLLLCLIKTTGNVSDKQCTQTWERAETRFPSVVSAGCLLHSKAAYHINSCSLAGKTSTLM